MITPAWCRMMAAYNAEMNRRFYAAAARLPDAARRREEGAFFGSLHRTLCHLLWADMAWMARFDGGPPPPVGLAESPEMIAEFEALREARAATDARIVAWVETVEESTLAGDLRWYSQSAGREMERPMAVAVTHLFLHQNHHRGQAHALLTRAGEDPGVTDLPFVLP
ncbi:DinB family protein [Pseudoroseomonas ludipueritiae]|uniref:DinB family protein n=1 Tax=Pseudoroseomonas ludipueritiae TaxID=198093 RepID=A0ABR7R3J1_9PROT|nr:DinB family protein [Pseudoroseomonas ludipueritiae]MBC9176264.1 DinB family protein [Pseudoroseomonas ludipueritiae]